MDENDALKRRLAQSPSLDQQVSASGVAPGTAAYYSVLEGAGASAVELDRWGSITHVTPAIQSLLGYAPDEVMLRDSLEWIHQDDRNQLVECFGKLFSSGDTTEPLSCRVRHKDGGWRAIELIARPYRNAEGALKLIAHLRDISAESDLNSAMSEERERHQLIDEMSRDVVLVIVAPDGGVIWANSGLTNLMGYSADDFRKPGEFSQKIHPDDRERIDAIFYDTLEEVGDTATYPPYRFCHKDGSYGWYAEVGRVYETLAGERQILCVVRDVTATHQVLEKLRESEERYRILDELNHDVILLMGDETGRPLWANSALEHVLGYSVDDIIETGNYFSYVHPDDLEDMLAIFGDGYSDVGQLIRYPAHRVRHKDGSWKWLTGIDKLCKNDSGKRFTISAIRDVTEQLESEEDRRRLAEQITESQRLESLGVMAGGIAHDFNNLLTPIVGESSLALLDLEPGSPLRRPLLKIRKAAHRAAALTNQMLAYSGQGPLLIEVIDLSQLVEDMAELLESNVSGAAVLSYSMAQELPAIEGDTSQLSQIVMNLISNAREAVEEGVGHIGIRTGAVDSADVDSDLIVGGNEVGAGRYVFLEVTDDGCGMQAETRLRIFDPFFTTKFTGRGLGLASVAGIVRGHKGLIVLDSEVGRGTRFQVLMPVTLKSSAEKPTPLEPRPPWHGEGTVLVVDDDAGVRELAAEALRRAGLRVLLASDGREGLELFRRNADEIMVVLLDRTMPTISGDSVFEEIRRLRPGTGVILMSGYSEDRAMAHMGKKLDAFLRKPFEPSALLDTIRRVVESKSD